MSTEGVRLLSFNMDEGEREVKRNREKSPGFPVIQMAQLLVDVETQRENVGCEMFFVLVV